MKKLNLKKKFEKLLSSEEYFIPIRRNLKIDYTSYYKIVLDPDGKKRNLINEKKSKLKQFKLILNYLKKFKKGGNILDVGCGFGWMLSRLNKKKWYRNGIEINDDCYNIAKKNMENFYKSIEEIKNINFDVITLIHVIEHLKDPVIYLDKIKKKLKKKWDTNS